MFTRLLPPYTQPCTEQGVNKVYGYISMKIFECKTSERVPGFRKIENRLHIIDGKTFILLADTQVYVSYDKTTRGE